MPAALPVLTSVALTASCGTSSSLTSPIKTRSCRRPVNGGQTSSEVNEDKKAPGRGQDVDESYKEGEN